MSTKINGENYRAGADGHIYKESGDAFLFWGELNGRSLTQAVKEIESRLDWSDSALDDEYDAN